MPQNELNQYATSVEHLSNEIFYEIFDYLDGCRIYQAFLNLNYRFQQLLYSSSRPLKIKFAKSVPEKILLNNYKQIILHNKHQIIAVHSSMSNDKHIVLLLNITSSFLHLQSLILDSVKSKLLRILIPKLIFQLPKLKYMNFSAIESKNSKITTSVSISRNNQFSPIESLVMNHPCTFYEVFLITSYTPQLDHLKIMEIDRSTLNLEISLPIILTNLTSIYLNMYYVTFDELENYHAGN